MTVQVLIVHYGFPILLHSHQDRKFESNVMKQ